MIFSQVLFTLDQLKLNVLICNMLKLYYSDWNTVFESHLQPATLKSSEIYQEMWKKQIKSAPWWSQQELHRHPAPLSVSVSWPMVEGGSMTRRRRPLPPQSWRHTHTDTHRSAHTHHHDNPNSSFISSQLWTMLFMKRFHPAPFGRLFTILVLFSHFSMFISFIPQKKKKKKKKGCQVPAEVTREHCPPVAPPPGMSSPVSLLPADPQALELAL